MYSFTDFQQFWIYHRDGAIIKNDKKRIIKIDAISDYEAILLKHADRNNIRNIISNPIITWKSVLTLKDSLNIGSDMIIRSPFVTTNFLKEHYPDPENIPEILLYNSKCEEFLLLDGREKTVASMVIDEDYDYIFRNFSCTFYKTVGIESFTLPCIFSNSNLDEKFYENHVFNNFEQNESFWYDFSMWIHNETSFIEKYLDKLTIDIFVNSEIQPIIIEKWLENNTIENLNLDYEIIKINESLFLKLLDRLKEEPEKLLKLCGIYCNVLDPTIETRNRVFQILSAEDNGRYRMNNMYRFKVDIIRTWVDAFDLFNDSDFMRFGQLPEFIHDNILCKKSLFQDILNNEKIRNERIYGAKLNGNIDNLASTGSIDFISIYDSLLSLKTIKKHEKILYKSFMNVEFNNILERNKAEKNFRLLPRIDIDELQRRILVNENKKLYSPGNKGYLTAKNDFESKI